ncbi:hypothetical protein SAY86_008793 [Trapa natans]|uniref:Uncharacterized protein n=1 Tax=Trapa natans TaxID=22666 RepID=A0AAN7QEZ7_TRANT|nr:hypothetical protein SAY86_008793 [Trapa natans]
MEVNIRAVHDWVCFPRESMEELRRRLFCISVELEDTKVAAHEELRRRDYHLVQLRGLLEAIAGERDEALDKYQKALLENLVLHQKMEEAAAAARPASGVSSVVDEPRRAREKESSNATFTGGLSTPDCEDSVVSSSPIADPIQPPPCKPTERSLDSLPVPETPLP